MGQLGVPMTMACSALLPTVPMFLDPAALFADCSFPSVALSPKSVSNTYT